MKFLFSPDEMLAVLQVDLLGLLLVRPGPAGAAAGGPLAGLGHVAI